MSFLAPIGLLALVSLPLIVLLHMRHFTPYVRHVPTLRFWREAEPTRTDDSRFRRPPLTLLLILQLLAAGLLGVALARPAISQGWSGISQQAAMRHLVVILDGSTSMSATDTPEQETRFEVARAAAADQIAALREGDIATLMVLGTQVITLQATDGPSMERLLDQLREMDQPGGIADLNAALKLISDLDLPGVREEIAILSDGAVSADPAVVDALNATVSLQQIGEPATGNLAITEATVRSSLSAPGQSDVYVQVTNFSESRVSTTVLAAADGASIFEQDLGLEPNSSTDVVISAVPAGTSELIVEVRSDDLLFADNRVELPLRQTSDFALRILLVSDTPSLLQRAFGSLPGAEIDTVGSTEYEQGSVPPGPFDLVVFEGTGPANGAIPDVPMMLINPPRGGFIPMAGMVTSPTVERVRANDPVLRGVDLTGLTFFEMPAHVLDSTAVEIVGAEGGSLIYRADVPNRDQKMIVLAFDLQQSNLGQRIAFPVLMANVVSELAPNPLPSTLRTGEALIYTPHAAVTSVQITDPRGAVTDLPVAAGTGDGQQSSLARQVTFTATGTPGSYQLVELNGSGQTVASASFVVNAGHPRESDLRADPQLEETLALADRSSESGSQRIMNDLWPLLVALAVAALLAEWLWALRPGRRLASLRGTAV